MIHPSQLLNWEEVTVRKRDVTSLEWVCLLGQPEVLLAVVFRDPLESAIGDLDGVLIDVLTVSVDQRKSIWVPLIQPDLFASKFLRRIIR